MRRNHIWAIVGLTAALVAAGFLFFPKGDSGTLNTSAAALTRPTAKSAVPVVTARVIEAPFTETLEALGTAKANESVVITPTVEDRVMGIFFDDGDAVDQGQLLVKLDDSEARYQLVEARAALHEQQKQYERMRRLAKTNATSRAQLDEERSLLDIAAAKVANLEARLQDYAIRAPFAGILGIRQVSKGAVVDSDTVITTLDDTTIIKLDFTIPETYLGVIRHGMALTARSAAYPDRIFQGSVSAISSRVDPETRTLTIRARLSNPDQRLKPGMLLKVDMIKNRARSLIIPEEAVVLDKDKSYTLVVTPDNTVARTEIVTGRRSPGKVEVLSGLSASQQVIIKGITRVRPGTAVEVVEVRDFGGQSG